MSYINIITYIIIILFDIFAIYFVISSRFMLYPPLIISSGKIYDTIIKKVSEHIRECEKNIDYPMTTIDAGSGIGTIITPLARAFPNHNFIGIEWSLLPYLVSKFRARNISNLKIVHKDMFKYDFAEADIIICFLIKHIMQRFTDKCKLELKKKGNRVYSSRFKLENIEPIEAIDLGNKLSCIYVYEYNK